MAVGRLQIKRVSLPGEQPESFQVSHEKYAGGEFVGTVQKDHLSKFLHETLHMDSDFVQRLLDELYLHGEAVVPEVELHQADLAASGLKHLPEER